MPSIESFDNRRVIFYKKIVTAPINNSCLATIKDWENTFHFNCHIVYYITFVRKNFCALAKYYLRRKYKNVHISAMQFSAKVRTVLGVHKTFTAGQNQQKCWSCLSWRFLVHNYTVFWLSSVLLVIRKWCTCTIDKISMYVICIHSSQYTVFLKKERYIIQSIKE